MKITFVLSIALCVSVQCFAGTVQICAVHYKGDGQDYIDEFSHGPITIRPGVVFTYAGHTFGGASDPKDDNHQPDGSNLWVGISSAERARRTALWREDMSDLRLGNATSAVVVTSRVTLTKKQNCVKAEARPIVSEDWKWDVSTIFADQSLYYQAFGFIANGKLETGFENDVNPFEHVAARGELNLVVETTLDEPVTLPDRP